MQIFFWKSRAGLFPLHRVVFAVSTANFVWLGLVCQAYFGNSRGIHSVLTTIITFLAPEISSGFLCQASNKTTFAHVKDVF